MNKKRGDKFILGFWNYNDIETSGADEIERWADLGLNVAMTPYLRDDEEARAFLPGWLDALEAKGMKAILRFNDIGDSVLKARGEEYFREAFTRRYNEFGKHPAVLGFYPGEEPNEGNYQYFAEELRLMNEMAPELTPFVDLGACEEHTRYIGEHAHTPNCGFGNYSQMEPEERGTDDYFRIMRKQIEVCDEYDMDCWATLLSSGHYRFREPGYYDYVWQINTAAACGCTGIVWFRLYDKLIAADYHGSPINEFGENGIHYDDMRRAQKRFMHHHGELIMKLQRQATFMIKTRYGGYPFFPKEGYSKIRRAFCSDTFLGYYDKETTPGIVSFFKDEAGEEYVALVNNNPYVSGSITLDLDPSVTVFERIYENGKVRIPERMNHGDRTALPTFEEVWLAPGQMEIFHIG